MSKDFTESELEAYLDEALAPDEMMAVEAALRGNRELAKRLTKINGRRDAGVHSIGEIWRRHRVSCPTREQLGSFLLGTLDDEQTAYLHFHIQEIGCRFCRANLDDLKMQQEESSEAKVSRRRKYFQSSAGYLGKK
jgi:hypothetical protein